MKRTTRLVLSVAAGCLAMGLAFAYGSSVRAEAEQARQEMLAAYGGDLVTVCVASRAIEPGEELDESNVRAEEWVASLLPPGAETSIEELVGRRATSTVPERAVICPAYLEERGGALEVPEGMVAVSVTADASHAVGGSVAPGDEVDVYVSNAGVADLLCRARILETSAHASETDGADLSWVTLAVEPERVEELLAATAKGTVSLTVPGAGASSGTDEETPAGDVDEAGGDGAPADADAAETEDAETEDADAVAAGDGSSDDGNAGEETS